MNNVGSYYGVMKHHASYKRTKEFNWLVYEKVVASFE